MRIGLDVAQHQLLWPELAARVQFAEHAGFDGAWVFDHFKPLYGNPNGPCMEGWTLLAGLAAQTSRIRLGVLVTGVTYRHPSILAAEAVTIDHISKGRHYQLEDAGYHPRPVQKPHPPIWIGAGGEQLMLPIVARRADAWHAFGSEQSMVAKSGLLDELAEKAGRDPKRILRSASLSLSRPWDQVRRRATQLRQAGFGYLIAEWPSEGKRRLDEFVEKVMPALVG